MRKARANLYQIGPFLKVVMYIAECANVSSHMTHDCVSTIIFVIRQEGKWQVDKCLQVAIAREY